MKIAKNIPSMSEKESEKYTRKLARIAEKILDMNEKELGEYIHKLVYQELDKKMKQGKIPSQSLRIDIKGGAYDLKKDR